VIATAATAGGRGDQSSCRRKLVGIALGEERVLFDWGAAHERGSAAYWVDQARRSAPTRLSFRLGCSLREEVVACLLGGHGMPAPLALAAFERVRTELDLSMPVEPEALERLLLEPMMVAGFPRPRRYRFPRQRARRVSAALDALSESEAPLEVIKGSTQKAKAGGTIGRAPLGYLNVRRVENGRESRTVEVDPLRGPLMKWAFEAYASGDWTLRPLLDELTKRGLRSQRTQKTPEKPLELSHLHKLLRHPYYKGIVRYRGAEYPGRHQPLVDEATWQRVQELLASKNQSGEKHRIHHHYLKGSLYCGGCGSRMVVSINRNRYGTRYPYFVCLGRHQKRTDCTLRYVRIETVEELVTEHYRSIQLTPAERELVEARLSQDFAAFREEVEVESQALERQKQRLLVERTKLLQAHYADAIPLDLLRSEQARIADQLDYIKERLEATGRQEAVVNFNLSRALRLATNVYDAYRASDSTRRRLLNQAFFKKLIIDIDGVRSEFAEPYDILLSPQLRVTQETTSPTKVGEPAPSEPDWATWEASFNNDEPRRPGGRRGSKDAIMVGAGGFEPP
jgi:hypothetical protein